MHQSLKRKLVVFARQRLMQQALCHGRINTPGLLRDAADALNENALTIGLCAAICGHIAAQCR